ncbi:hypothetical protein GQ457_03G044900 [Hibiscus cannabinus]
MCPSNILAYEDVVATCKDVPSKYFCPGSGFELRACLFSLLSLTFKLVGFHGLMLFPAVFPLRSFPLLSG